MLRKAFAVIEALCLTVMGVVAAAAVAALAASVFKPDLPDEVMSRSPLIGLGGFLITMAVALSFSYVRDRFAERLGLEQRKQWRWVGNLCGLLAFAAMVQFAYLQFATPGIGLQFDGENWEARNRSAAEVVTRIEALSICWLTIRASSLLILATALHELTTCLRIGTGRLAAKR